MVKLILILLIGWPLVSMAQSAKSYAVLMERIGTGLPIKIGWDYDVDASSYQLYRRVPGSNSWGAPIANLNVNDTSYTENNLLTGSFEYYVQKNLKNGKLGAGYLFTSTQVRSYQTTGRILVLVDGNYVIPLKKEVNELIEDLVADGWFVDTLVIKRTESVLAVKQKITTWYKLYENESVKPEALYLLGKIPVPYSGEIFPDGHRPDHRGAWPADVYYGVMNESIWTDNKIDSDSAAQSRNKNLIGDGKYDVSLIYPDTTSLQIGRVDLSDMPLFGTSDTLLVKRYLDKAHEFKRLGFIPSKKAIIDDNFGAMNGEAFAASGWRSFGSILGKSNLKSGDYLPEVKNNGYLLSYGCGPGTYTSATGIATSNDFNSDSINTVFTMLFGSYFGDWDNTNNFLRAPLCSKPMALASIWSGRPHWNLHPMGVGHTIGYCARLTQNNMDGRLLQPQTVSGYVSSSFPTFVHIALMGDPSLRLVYNNIPTQIQATANADSSQFVLNWQVIPNATAYDVYVTQNPMQIGKRMARVTTNSYTLTKLFPGENRVFIRGVFQESSPSGLYEQLSLAGFTNITGGVNATGVGRIDALNKVVIIYPNPSNTWFAVAAKQPIRQVKVYRLTGETVLIIDDVKSGTPVHHQLTKGLYIVEVNDGAHILYQKLLVE